MEAVREYAASEGDEVLEEIKDPVYSGASLKRPGMDRIRDLVAAGRASVVLAQDRDHFAREPAHHYHLEKAFEEKGIKLRPHNNRGTTPPEIVSWAISRTTWQDTSGRSDGDYSKPGYEKKRSSVQSEIDVLRHELGKQGDLDNETKRIGTQHTGLLSFSFEDFDQFQQIHPQTDAYATRETEGLRNNDPIQSEWDGEGQAVVRGVYYRPAVRSPAPDLSKGG
jgi:hypothetical protein